MKPLKHRPDSLNGFTLLDALIALVVLAVGLLALGRFHAAALLNSADAKARTQATNLAEAKMNELKAFYSLSRYEDIKSSTADETSSTAGTDLAISGMDWVESFQRSWTIGQTVGGVYYPGEYAGPYLCDKNPNPVLKSCSAGTPCLCPDSACKPIATSLTDNCHQKRIHTRVRWTDALGVAASIHLQSIIERVDPIWAGYAVGP